MRVFLNELALAEAWTSTSSVLRPLIQILQARQQEPTLRDALYCANGMGKVRNAAGVPLSRAAQNLPRDTRVQLFEWIAKHGPFIDDDRQYIDQDLFFFDDDEVTDLGLGEAARRIHANLCAAILSLVGNQHSRFSGSLLRVVQGFPDEPIAEFSVPNYTEFEPLVDVLHALAPNPTNWHDFLNVCRNRFDLLHIGPHCNETLKRFTYMPAAARQIMALLNVLQCVRAEMDHTGQLTPRGLELRNTYFTGKAARFSNESESRRNQPRNFTFPDPEGGNDVVCFWHGKVSIAAIRMHFDWPVDPNAKRLRVVYIGQHI